ncbi:hypothetical protein TNCV_610051 [Trichonephila clavipes]|nr:hypothetical protein TNCV_610051 [Trichonephila clavipes]
MRLQLNSKNNGMLSVKMPKSKSTKFKMRRRQAHKYQLHDLVAIKRTQFGPGLRGRLPGHDGRCRVGYVQWTTPPPVLRVEQSTLTLHSVRNVRLKDTRENTQSDVRDAKL